VLHSTAWEQGRHRRTGKWKQNQESKHRRQLKASALAHETDNGSDRQMPTARDRACSKVHAGRWRKITQVKKTGAGPSGASDGENQRHGGTRREDRRACVSRQPGQTRIEEARRAPGGAG
jgi:hypothetical protein